MAALSKFPQRIIEPKIFAYDIVTFARPGFAPAREFNTKKTRVRPERSWNKRLKRFSGKTTSGSQENPEQDCMDILIGAKF